MASGTMHIPSRAGTAVIAGAMLLLASMCVQWSFGPAYLVRLHQVREEMKASILSGLSEDEITTLHFPMSEVERIAWKDGGREVRVEGDLFDVVRVKWRSDGSVFITAVRDDKEGHVLAELDSHVRLHLGQDARGKERGVRIISAWADFCVQLTRLSIPAPPAADRSYVDQVRQLQGNHVEVDPEPPRMS